MPHDPTPALVAALLERPGRHLDLAGRDYLDLPHAAAYAQVSESQFRAKALEYGLISFWWMGKKVWRKGDIQRAMEREFARQTQALGSGRRSA